MNLDEAQKKLALRLCDWSRRDLIREMSEGCPLLSSVGLNNRYVAAFVSWVRTMPTSERETLARALTRRTHEAAAAILGETLSSQEKKRFNEMFFQEVASRQSSLPPLTTADESLPSFIPVDPNQCLEYVCRAAFSGLGQPVRRKLEARAVRVAGDWQLVTAFTFHLPDNYLFYEYDFVRKDGKSTSGRRSFFPRNLFLLYGITNTMVYVPSDADSEPMAGAIVKLAEHFIRQAEPIFEGLGVND